MLFLKLYLMDNLVSAVCILIHRLASRILWFVVTSQSFIIYSLFRQMVEIIVLFLPNYFFGKRATAMPRIESSPSWFLAS